MTTDRESSKNQPAQTPKADLPPLPKAPRQARRGSILGFLIFLFLAAGAGWYAYWQIYLSQKESTDDAYAAGNQVRIAPQVSGTVREILVDNTQAVKAGQVLLRLDPTDADLALEQARASLAETTRGTSSLMAQAERLRAVIDLRDKELAKVRGDYSRRLKPKAAYSVSEEDLAHARDAVAIAEAAIRAANQDLEATRRLLLNTPLAEQPMVRQSAHRLREAWLARQRCEIKSPAAGHVARRTVQVGAQVTPGTALMAVVPLDDLWVDANFKEGQLGRMRIGQPATVRADMYGKKFTHHGKVIGLSAGTGSVFSLLPPENATGNWIKVVQRVPVKIALDPRDLQTAPLLIGLSCMVEVDVSDTGGPMLAEAAKTSEPLYQTEALDRDMTAVDEEIAAIVAANSEAPAQPDKQ